VHIAHCHFFLLLRGGQRWHIMSSSSSFSRVVL
jgi:hypothetical protein